jgi:hypothetical protein
LPGARRRTRPFARAEEVEELLILVAFGQGSQASCHIGGERLDPPDLLQETIQVRLDHGLPHRGDQVRRERGQGLGGQDDLIPRDRVGRLAGIEELDAQVVPDLLEQFGLLERLADEVVGPDPQERLQG